MKRLCVCIFLSIASVINGAPPDSLRFCLRSEPRTFDPLLVDDSASETIRYLTGGVLIRFNRAQQKLEPALATAWHVRDNGRRIDFELRRGIQFSDGSPFGPEDVVFTVRRMMDPTTQSPLADSFRSAAGMVEARVTAPESVSLRFPAPVAGLAGLFDEVAIVSSRSPLKENAVLGPFMVSRRNPGVSLLLRRNPHYWEKSKDGRPLPYLDAIQIDIQQNRDAEALAFERSEVDLVQNLDPDIYDRLANRNIGGGGELFDSGASLDSEQMWFNESPAALIPAYKKAWFENVHFRRAVSIAIRRDDICRLIYHNHAVPALGPVSPSNREWFAANLAPRTSSLEAAWKELAADGFRQIDGALFDRDHHRVEFSLVTNAESKIHERMAALIQQDLDRLGIRLNVTTLDFSSLIERMTRTFSYEACLMSMVNTATDPNGQMSVWLSSGANHQWNPDQKAPATSWEAEIDHLMQHQSAASDPRQRKKDFDRVQEIAREQEPFIYLVHPNALTAVSQRVRNATPCQLRPQAYWNADRLWLAPAGQTASGRNR